MASNESFVLFLEDQIRSAGNIHHRKMFGEYLIYCDERPVFLVCDNTLFVRILPEVTLLLPDCATGFPYQGAKPHYQIDEFENGALLTSLAKTLARILLPPVKKKKSERRN